MQAVENNDFKKVYAIASSNKYKNISDVYLQRCFERSYQLGNDQIIQVLLSHLHKKITDIDLLEVSSKIATQCHNVLKSTTLSNLQKVLLSMIQNNILRIIDNFKPAEIPQILLHISNSPRINSYGHLLTYIVNAKNFGHASVESIGNLLRLFLQKNKKASYDYIKERMSEQQLSKLNELHSEKS